MLDNPRSLTILNQQGHLTYIWGPDNDSSIKKILVKKFDLGFDFFIIGKRTYDKLIPSTRIVINPDDINDMELRSFILGSYAQVIKTLFMNLNSSIICKDVDLISQSQCLAIKPLIRKDKVNVTSKSKT